jgi:hypothetical protein
MLLYYKLTLESLSLSTMNTVTSSMFSLIISKQESGSLMNPSTLIAAFLSNGLADVPNFYTYFIMIGYIIW